MAITPRPLRPADPSVCFALMAWDVPLTAFWSTVIAWSLFGIANLTLLFSVLTESWSLKYKSSIEKSKVRKALKLFHLPTTVLLKQTSGAVADTQFDEADAARNVNGVNGASTPAKKAADLPQQLIDAAKGFDEHAKFLMHGFHGDMPQNLKALMDAEHDPVKLQRIQLELGVSAAAEAHEARQEKFMLLLAAQAFSFRRSCSCIPTI